MIDGYLDRNRVHRETGDRIAGVILRGQDARVIFGGSQDSRHSASQGAEISGVKSGPQIDTEGIIDRSSKNRDSIVESVGSRVVQGAVVNRPWASVRRDGEERRAIRIVELRFLSTPHHADGIGLAKVQSRVVEVSNLRRNDQLPGMRIEGPVVANTGQSGVDAGQLVLGGKSKLEGDVSQRVSIVINLEFILDIGIEREPGRAISRFEEGIDVQDQGYLRNPIRPGRRAVAGECIEIGNVCLVIERGDRRLSMIGSVQRQRHDQRRNSNQQAYSLVSLHV